MTTNNYSLSVIYSLVFRRKDLSEAKPNVECSKFCSKLAAGVGWGGAGGGVGVGVKRIDGKTKSALPSEGKVLVILIKDI